MRWFLPALVLLPGLFRASAGEAADLARQVREAGLDPEECYRVRELQFAKEDARFYLTDGYLIFGKPVRGVRLSAVFTAEVDGGEAELLVLPPHRRERRSLASYIGTPNLNERFTTAVMLFTDETYLHLSEQIRAAGRPKSPEMGWLLAQSWDPVVRSLASSFEVHLVQDLFSRRRSSLGFFYGALNSPRLGEFDFLYDPRVRDQMLIGRVALRKNHTSIDIWTGFEARSFRTHKREAAGPDFALSNFRLDATLEPDLDLRATTRVTLTPGRNRERALPFNVSRHMRLAEVLINGEPAEFIQRGPLSSNLNRDEENDTFLVVPSEELEPGRPYEIEFRHRGAVVSEAGNRVYFVGARGIWYPHQGMLFADYDLTFRYPKDLNLVATGEIVEDRTEGDQRITRRRTVSPVRNVGFNLGDYVQANAARAGYKVEVYGNRHLERALQPKSRDVIVLPPTNPSAARVSGAVALPMPASAPDPTARLDKLASEVAAALEFMAAHFGPLPFKTLTVSPIPGTFGEGFPGLLYLSTLSYLGPAERPLAGTSEFQRTALLEILHAHETAHQWWGNIVTAAGYQDAWLMEALANYSALLLLEKRKGGKALESVLEEYKSHLLAKDEKGRTVESAGPIIWGTRLLSSHTPGAWRIITYEKGSWIIHMLRRRLGDARFLAMLGELRRRYQYQALATEQFRQLVREFVPPDSLDPALEVFFEQWIYGTGIPSLKLTYSVEGRAPKLKLSGALEQSEVEDSFSIAVPIEIQWGKGRPLTHWVRTAGEPVPFTLTLPQRPARVVLDPANSVLAVRK